MSMTGVMNRAENMTGLSVAAINAFSGSQTGLSLGLFNSADELHGVQIGLLNHAPNNPPWARWLPLVNAHFGDDEPSLLLEPALADDA